MNLKLSWKLAVIGISATVPLLCGTFYLINKYTDKDVTVARQEQHGNRCLRPLVALLEALPPHQVLVLRSSAGDRAAADQLAACEEQIDRSFDALETVLREPGPGRAEQVPGPAGQIHAPVKMSDLRREWLELVRQRPRATMQETVVRHARLLAGIRALITHIGNTSNLILDPDLDSYYLMDVTLVVLPQNLDRLARTLALGDELLRQPGLSANDRTQLAVQANQLQESDLNRLVRDVQTALAADADFHGVSASLQRELSPALKAQTEATEAFVGLLNRMAAAERPVVSPADFEAAGTKARQRSMELWGTGVAELDRLLQRRIDDLNRTRTWGLGLVALSLALTVGVTLGVARRMNRVEEALRESEEKFSRAFRSGPDAMSIAELEAGRYLEVNEGFERMWGFSRAEVVGRTSLELGLWHNVADREAFRVELLARGSVRGRECVGVNRRGEAIVYLMSSELLELGGKPCALSVAHDITDRIRAAEQEKQARKEFTRKLITSQETERRRIAKELHDSLGQNLLLIKNRAQLALARKDSPAELGSQVESIADLATQAIGEVRQISHDLRPYQLDQLGLTRALQAMIDSAAQATPIGFTCKLEPVDDVFAGTAATEMYRVVQESLNNIMKHSGATQVRIELERDVRQVRLWIEDDGRGFASNDRTGTASGLGLQNMAERAGMLGGQLVVDSKPGAGTRIELTVAIPDSG